MSSWKYRILILKNVFEWEITTIFGMGQIWVRTEGKTYSNITSYNIRNIGKNISKFESKGL